MIISELLSQKTSQEVRTIRAEANLLDAARALSEHNIGALMVMGPAGEIAGILSERDLARTLVDRREKALGLLVRDVMTARIVTCGVNDFVVDILDMMTRRGIRHVPVMEKGALVSILSIRDFNMAYRKLEALALTDYMTGLSNRRHFMTMLAREVGRRARFGTPLSLAMIDIDRFKAVNDTYGHATGDRVICALAMLLKQQCRIYDIVGRLGGEEYAILCPDTDLAGAGVLCQRVIEAIRGHRVETATGPLGFTASIGIYEMIGRSETPETMLERADALLYRAKDAGRDRIVAHGDMECEVAVA